MASTRGLGAAMGVFGTISDIGGAAGPIVSGFLIVRLGYAKLHQPARTAKISDPVKLP
jgi:hypothetical protein